MSLFLAYHVQVVKAIVHVHNDEISAKKVLIPLQKTLIMHDLQIVSSTLGFDSSNSKSIH